MNLYPPMTYYFINMNSYVSDPCLVYKKLPLTIGGVVDGLTAMIASAILVPGSNPHLDTTFLANLANFHVAAILAISTYKT